MAWICSKGKVHEDFEECDCPDEGTEGEEDPKGILECQHNWVLTGSSYMLDPRSGKSRKVNLYTCSKCKTSKNEWA